MELREYYLEYLSESWNQFGKILGVRLTGMQSKVGSLSRIWNYTMKLYEEVKKNPKTKYPYFLVDVFRISGTRFILRGRIVTP